MPKTYGKALVKKYIIDDIDTKIFHWNFSGLRKIEEESIDNQINCYQVVRNRLSYEYMILPKSFLENVVIKKLPAS